MASKKNTSLLSISPQDIIVAGRWDAALFTSYALSLSFFEAAPLIALRRTGCRSVTILTDVEGYRVSVSEAGVTQVGRTYELGPVSVAKGIFHPKIMLLIGKDGPRAAIGSGNLTFNGWGGNLEMLDYLAPAAAAGAFGDLADFFEKLQATPRVNAVWPDFTRFIDVCRAASRNENDGLIRVLHSLERSIADQIVDAADQLGGAVSATFISPFFGSVRAVKSLAEKLRIERVSVLVPTTTPEYFPFKAADAAGFKIHAVTAPIFSNDNRRLHAKAIEVVCRHGRLFLSGSVNATNPALAEAQNVEVGILRILGAADLFGWKAAARPKIAGVGGVMPAQSSEPVLVAHFDGTSIKGRIFGIAKPASEWSGLLTEDASEKAFIKAITVDADGTFDFRISDTGYDVWLGRSALRFALRNGPVQVSGWVMLAPYLEAIRERGPIAEAVIRLVSGSEDYSDIEIILGFFVENPDALLSISRTRTNATVSDARPETRQNINVGDLVPISRQAALQSGTSDGDRSAFERLLDSLRSHVESHPLPAVEIEEEEDEEASRAATDSRRRNYVHKIPHQDFHRLFDAFANRIESMPEGDIGRRSGLLTLLDLGLFFTARAEEPFVVRAEFLRKWLTLAFRLTQSSEPVDELEQSLCLVLLAGVVSGKDQPQHALALMQRRIGGVATPGRIKSVNPIVNSRRAVALISDATPIMWSAALEGVVGSRTPWMDAVEVWDAISVCKEIPEHNLLLRHPEASIFRNILAGEDSIDRIRVIKRREGKPSCPKCNITLPTAEAYRLRNEHIAVAAGCCNRILLDLEP